MLLKEIEKLLKLCRKQGVIEFTTPDIAFKLGEIPTKTSSTEEIDLEDIHSFDNFPDGPLTPEELTFFANGGRPEENPYRKTSN